MICQEVFINYSVIIIIKTMVIIGKGITYMMERNPINVSHLLFLVNLCLLIQGLSSRSLVLFSVTRLQEGPWGVQRGPLIVDEPRVSSTIDVDSEEELRLVQTTRCTSRVHRDDESSLRLVVRSVVYPFCTGPEDGPVLVTTSPCRRQLVSPRRELPPTESKHPRWTVGSYRVPVYWVPEYPSNITSVVSADTSSFTVVF